jgi:release factor glutamine methyltransferase
MSESITELLHSAAEQLAASSPTALLDAEVLLCHCLNKNRSFLRTWPEKQLSAEQRDKFRSLISQRENGVPVAYLTAQREFWSRNFKVSPEVLIPRPDSELLIELCLERLADKHNAKIIDLGTGSGILAITLAAERQLAEVTATDISPKALAIAKQNAENLGVKVRFIHSHWLDDVLDQDFDIIISNPPYIAAHDPHLQQGDVRFEPDCALISAENGLKDIQLIVEQSRQHLRNSGLLLIEHGYNQQNAVQAIFKACKYQDISTHPDLSGNPRVTLGLWNPL